MDNFSITFNSKYKDHIKDLIKYKISSLFSTILISIIIFFIGVYVSYIDYNRVINFFNKSYDESGVVVSLLKKKNFLILSNEKAKEYFIPLNALSEFDKNKLIDLSNNFKNIINNK